MLRFLGLFIVFILSAPTVFSADMRFIQIDGVFHSEKNSQKLETLVEKINKEKNVEFVVFTGNNISKPNKKDLESFVKTTKALKVPYYVVLGNKDTNKQQELGKKEYVEYLSKNIKSHKKIKSPNYAFKKKNLVFIAVDGSKEVLPSSMGYYRPNVLDWLDEQLDINRDKKVVILQHFPIVPPAKKESYYTYKADEYLNMLSTHKNVKAVIAGHFNVNNEQTVNNILHIATQNAPKYRVIDILDYDNENPTFWSTIKE